ncbi:phosphotransferase family protein [Nocardioides acrostichi]|uniref:Aminoglycoside phosphotransferase family protein n=1 Tax=Nocardioides acrostichi TaxID=2784339 RepID=A0A930V2B7_9ACTN|nr:aminoglycoside phosphotransferase family protein [Nocardioides acrostichi]MBF4161914.1 aminoglycoside phosphotransferase family protein [Nocardioides acrostichi]
MGSPYGVRGLAWEDRAMLDADLIPLAGGWSGRTFLAQAGEERTVVRLYPPEPIDAPARDAAVLAYARQVLAGVAEVPAVLEVRAGDAGRDRPGLVVTPFLPGERGDLVTPGLADDALVALAERLADVLDALSGSRQPRTGVFADATLTLDPLPEPFDGDGLPDLLDVLAPALVTHVGERALAGLAPVCRRAQDLLDDDLAARPGACLVHSDLNPKNLLLGPAGADGGDPALVVLDWEYAHAGGRWTDPGNLLRFERREAFVDALAGRLAADRGLPASEVLDLARAADLTALLELASRAEANPVATRAADRLRTIAETGDLHASGG